MVEVKSQTKTRITSAAEHFGDTTWEIERFQGTTYLTRDPVMHQGKLFLSVEELLKLAKALKKNGKRI